MKNRKPGWTASLAGQAAETNEATEVSYSGHTVSASRESMLVEKQLAWTIGTVHNGGIRKHERRCLLLLAGAILLDFLARETMGAGK